MRKGKRLLSLLLALLMSVGVFSGLATTAFAASDEMTLYMYDLPRGGANKEAWGHGALSLMGGWSSKGRDGFWSVFCKDSYSAEGVGVARSTTHRYLQELSDRNLIDYGRGILSAPQSAKMKTAYVSAPLVGSIRCGNPEDEEESIEEYVSLPVSMFGKGDFYILRAKGDSMVDAGIDEDDLLVIERNCPALEGDIVVALDEDNQNTLKRYAGYDKDSGYYILEYENEARYPGKTIKVRSFQVQGVARHVIKSL